MRQTAPLHLVIGRFVDWPVLNDLDRARVNLCVERWAAALREHREPQDGTEVPYVGATARLYELELARDDAFGFFERTTHRKVPLLEGYPEEYSDDESVRREARKKKKKNPGPGLLGQLFVLLERRWKIFFRDKTQLFLQLAMLIIFPIVVVIFAIDGIPQPKNPRCADRGLG